LIQTTYDFINRHLSDRLQKMVPLDLVRNDPDRNWCLGQPGEAYLVYALAGGSVTLDLSKAAGAFRARWFDPRTGAIQSDAAQDVVRGGGVVTFAAPDASDWVLWLSVVRDARGGREPQTQPGR
jgi:hypothetical protein